MGRGRRRRAHLVAGDAVVGVRGWGVVGAAVQGLGGLWAGFDVCTIQGAGVLQQCVRKRHLAEVIWRGQGVPAVGGLVIRGKLRDVRLCKKTKQLLSPPPF